MGCRGGRGRESYADRSNQRKGSGREYYRFIRGAKGGGSAEECDLGLSYCDQGMEHTNLGQEYRKNGFRMALLFRRNPMHSNKSALELAMWTPKPSKVSNSDRHARSSKNAQQRTSPWKSNYPKKKNVKDQWILLPKLLYQVTS